MQVNIALLTVTDTRTIHTDKSGAILVKKINEQNHKLIDRKIVKDEKEEIKKIPPPIPTTPEINPKVPPIKIEICTGIFL